MAWYALYKWYKNWSKREYPNMIEWYSMKLNPPVFKTIKYCNIEKYKHKYN